MPGKRNAGRCKAVKPETRPRELAWSSERLVSECCKGNQAAWSALIDKYKNLIFSIPIKFGLSRDDAADICQAVCVDLLSDLPRLREPRALPKWLMQASYHKCLRFRKRFCCGSFLDMCRVIEQIQFLAFRDRVLALWWRTLRRRSQKHRISWTRTLALAQRWLPQPSTLHPFPDARFAAIHLR